MTRNNCDIERDNRLCIVAGLIAFPSSYNCEFCMLRFSLFMLEFMNHLLFSLPLSLSLLLLSIDRLLLCSTKHSSEFEHADCQCDC